MEVRGNRRNNIFRDKELLPGEMRGILEKYYAGLAKSVIKIKENQVMSIDTYSLFYLGWNVLKLRELLIL